MTITHPLMNAPATELKVAKAGTRSGSTIAVTMFQSKVGRGFKSPIPLLKPVSMLSVWLLGAIQVIQEK